jgi:hypothetical protein
MTAVGRPRRRRGTSTLAAIGIVLVLGIVIGLAHEPDLGTPVSVHRADISGAVVGADHAKPLPSVRSMTDLLALWRVFTPVLLALALLLGSTWRRTLRTDPDRHWHPSVAWSLARARRGPPALV